MDFESAATQLSMMFSKSTELCALMNPSVNWGSTFDDDFRAVSDSFFRDDVRFKWDCER
jgi:hypothetical protein